MADYLGSDGRSVIASVVVNYEEGSEYSILDGDPKGETSGESPSNVPVGDRDLANESFFEYGSRAGVWRIMNVMDKYHVKGTFFCCAQALEKNPEVGPEIIRGVRASSIRIESTSSTTA